MFLLEEIDKPGAGTHNGHVWHTLLKLFEPTNSSQYYDECLQGIANLSYINWICTANDVSQLPGPLLDRLEVFEVGYPKQEHYEGIVHGIIRSYQRRYGLHDAMVPRLGAVEWEWLKKYFTSPRRARKATERLLSVMLTQSHGLVH